MKGKENRTKDRVGIEFGLHNDEPGAHLKNAEIQLASYPRRLQKPEHREWVRSQVRVDL